jgi:hypothetical protein
MLVSVRILPSCFIVTEHFEFVVNRCSRLNVLTIVLEVERWKYVNIEMEAMMMRRNSSLSEIRFVDMSHNGNSTVRYWDTTRITYGQQ